MIEMKWKNGTINEKSMKNRGNDMNNQNNQDNQKIIFPSSSNMGLNNNTNYTFLESNESQENFINTHNPQLTGDLRQGLDGIDLNKEIFTQRSKHREEQNEKLSTRSMVIQKNINPFVTEGTYVEHLDAEDSFLRPRDSNYGEQVHM